MLTIQVGDNESSKYWLSVLNELKNRGVRDILVICADGLTGIKEAIGAAFPKTEYQRCIDIHFFNCYIQSKGENPILKISTLYYHRRFLFRDLSS